MGAGGEWDILRGDLAAHPQPGIDVAVAFFSYFNSGNARNGCGSTAILTGENSAHFWIVLLLTYDVVFTTACLALFEKVLEAE